jgi:hypothetical protein
VAKAKSHSIIHIEITSAREIFIMRTDSDIKKDVEERKTWKTN